MKSLNRKQINGALAFHKNTEIELAKYVQEHATQDDPESVIATVDEFCWNNHWMMHVGDVKGKIVDDILKEVNPNIILELGTYCGYSAIRMARFLKPGGKLYTIDPFPLETSKILINKSGFSDRIICLEGYANEIIPTLLNLKNKIDVVFIDHEKKMYCPDLHTIEQNNLLHKNSTIIADNVIVFKINDYLDHVRKSGLYESKNYLSTLEYQESNDQSFVDGIEVSKFIG